MSERDDQLRNDPVRQLATRRAVEYQRATGATPRKVDAYRDGWLRGFRDTIERHPALAEAINGRVVGRVERELLALLTVLRRGP